MPQMAPYNWLILFLTFNLIMIFIITINYYLLMPHKKIQKFNYFYNKYILMW